MYFIKKISLYAFVIILVTAWMFSGWPAFLNFPPQINQAQAAQEILRPNATGDDEAWTPNTSTDYGDTGDDDVGDTTYISSGTDETRDIMNMTNPTFGSGDTINWVEMHMKCQSDGSGGPERMNGITRLSGTDRIDLNNTSISTATFSEYTGAQQTLNPSDGAWSYTDLQNLQIGGQIKSIGGGETIDCDEFWVVVDHSPAGTLTIDIVDSGGSPVASPSIAMSSINVSFSFQTPTGTFGTASEKIRITNTTATATWTASVAASGGTTDFWDSAGTDYDFNDPTAGAGDGGDGDSLGGQMTVDASGSTITPEGGCTSTGITKGSSASFSEGVTDSITILSAGATADTGCYWDQTGISISQTVPAEQPAASDYNIDMVVSVVAS